MTAPRRPPEPDRLSRAEPYLTLTLDDEREPVVIEPYVNDTLAPFASLAEMIAGLNRDVRFAELKVKRQTPGASRTRVISSRQPRTRGRESHRGQAGHRRTRSSTRAGPSSDSDSDGDGPSPARRRVVLDERYIVIGLEAVAA